MVFNAAYSGSFKEVYSNNEKIQGPVDSEHRVALDIR